MDMRKYKKKLIVASIVLGVSILIPVGSTLAKWLAKDEIRTNTIEEDTADFYVEITDKDKNPVINSIGIEELYPGAKKTVDFYVRSGENGKKLDVDITYTISLMHTKNLPINYKLYEITDDKENEKPIDKKEEIFNSYNKFDVENCYKLINNIYIIKHVEIPTAIVECGFLSNTEELELLKTQEYQDKLAWGIYVGIMDYFLE